jgi:Mcm10 replication factor
LVDLGSEPFSFLLSGNRTVCLDKIPKNSCSNCQSSKWEKTTMMREKKGILVGEQLSIRGDEEQYIGSLSTANVNLLVPDT